MAQQTANRDTNLSVLLAMAMFVLIVDTSLMNVSISSVVKSLDTTVSSVQAAIALEALISAAFILISSKVSDLIGRKRAYIIGLMAYGAGALAMTLAQNLTTIIIFWAVIGGLGASLLLPAMQSLIHANFSGIAQKKAYALVGAAAAVAAAIGPLLGGFITTYFSYRTAFLLEFAIIVVVILGSKLIKDAPYTGSRQIDLVGASLSILGMGGVVLGILAWQEGGKYVGLFITIGVLTLALLAKWLTSRDKQHKNVLIDPKLFQSAAFRLGITSQMMQNIVLGGAMIALPIFLQIALEYDAMKTGLSIAPLSLSMFAVAIIAGRKFSHVQPGKLIRLGFMLTTFGLLALLPVIPRAESGWLMLVPLAITGAGLGLLVSQLNNYTLAPIKQNRVSEAAGINSAAGSFGLSFGLAVAGGVLLAALSLSFTNLVNENDAIPAAQKQQLTSKLETSAEVVSNSQLQTALVGEPQAVREAVLEINETATHRALQIALAVPAIAAITGLLISLHMDEVAAVAKSRRNS